MTTIEVCKEIIKLKKQNVSVEDISIRLNLSIEQVKQVLEALS